MNEKQPYIDIDADACGGARASFLYAGLVGR